MDSTNSALPDNSNSNNNIQSNMSNPENESPQQSNMKSIDFTADINLDQLDELKNMTDEDVLQNLEEIENMDLNSSSLQVQEENQSMEKSTESKNSNSENDRPIQASEVNDNINIDKKLPDNVDKDIKGEVVVQSGKNGWYKKKLMEKEAIIKERLSKVARVLGISYPSYEKWLEYEEKVNGSPLCKLKPSRHCCLDKPYTNRWKFNCNKRRIFDSTIKAENSNSSFNKSTDVIWKLDASGAWGVNVNNKSEFPPFVLHAVKIFEDFLQTTEQLVSQNSVNENFSDNVSMDVESRKETYNEGRQDWLWLVVRCNSMDELMLFATGKNINRSTMDRLKQVYESGPGKDCNVKSLYCKSIDKCEDSTVTNTTFLVGSEALDEIVGGLKIQLAPKTNFWSNTAGAENVANAVMDLLAPTPRTTVLEIGCGIGLIGLMMASKCQQVIGVDSPSEVEEAEMTCELNNIKNASFIMGSPAEVTAKIIDGVKNRKTCAIINTNTIFGRAIEVMTCLRKIPSLKRIVMITTLTKQSVRAILELARPGDHSHGSPFIPVLACVVDTLPIGPHFEAVILMQRRMVYKFNHLWFQKIIEENVKDPEFKSAQGRIDEQSINGTDKKTSAKGTELQTKKNFNKSLVKHPTRKSKISLKKALYTKHVENLFAKNKFKGKRSHSPEKGEVPPKKLMKKFGKFGAKPWHADLSTKIKKEWNVETPQLRINTSCEKKMREHKEQTDLRERLSNSRLDTDIAQTVKEHQALLEIAKEKLSGPAPTVDINTAKKLQNMLNMVLEQTNKLQSQLPRSVWDRISPPDNVNLDQSEKKLDDSLLKGHYVQEIGSRDILITTPNQKFLNNEESMTKPIYKKYNNLPPLEPNTIVLVAPATDHRGERPFRITPERYHDSDVRQQQNEENSWNRDKTFERNRWNDMENIKKPISPMRRQTSPKRPLLSPPRRPCSPPRRHFSPLHRPMSPVYRQRSPIRCQMSPLRRPISPSRRPVSPRRLSPPRRQMSPVRCIMSPSRRQSSPMKRPVSPPRRQIPSPNRIMPLNKQEMLLSRRQTMLQERQQTSTMRRAESPQRFIFDRPTSPSRKQQSPQRRQMSPQKLGDEWDIPSRGAIEQTWTRPVERMPEKNIWRTEKTTSTSTNNWDQTACNERRRKIFNQEKWESDKDPVRNDTWNSSPNTWNSKQISAKSTMKETWSSSFDNRWSTTSNMPGNSNDNWNIRGKESFTNCKEPWVDNKKQGRWESVNNVKESWKQCNKEDVNDLPDDAKDPWGDDGTSDLKERWLKFENTASSSTWVRENKLQKRDAWGKLEDNWQNKGVPFRTKSQWQNNGIQNAGEPRWLSQNDIEKKTSTSGWQSGNNVGSWKFQNSNFQSQRSFSTTPFKGLY
ncbi:tRNA (uracil(54)-C(5))-methyltransferase like protein [Habropoda laboriosa]|uniref:tRNA (uracil(54)-C(5))-methyltransferase n=2 Tax=Habropoda laboriosa TaxID=597456 RepID=A0A0L7QLD1_9HYME|nr:tRNA (uracil(54)-C(5))-methyltransferase like protein [Habropoda laboriosa]